MDYQKIKNISNVTTLQNYIIYFIDEINKRDDKLQKLMKENSNLITRMRNINIKQFFYLIFLDIYFKIFGIQKTVQ